MSLSTSDVKSKSTYDKDRETKGPDDAEGSFQRSTDPRDPKPPLVNTNTRGHMDKLHSAIEDDEGVVPALLAVIESAANNLHEAAKDTSMDDGARHRIAHEVAHLRSAVTKAREIKLDPSLRAKDDDEGKAKGKGASATKK